MSESVHGPRPHANIRPYIVGNYSEEDLAK